MKLILKALNHHDRLLGSALAALLLVLELPTAKATTILWTNISGGNWSTSANWSPNQIPSSSDDVVIAMAGNYTTTLDTDATIGSLTVGGGSGQQTVAAGSHVLAISGAGIVNTNGTLSIGGTLSYSGVFTVNGTLNWTSGTLGTGGSAVSIGPGGLLAISGAGDRNSWCSLTNGGNVVWSGAGNWIMHQGATCNLFGGVFDIQNDQVLLANYQGALLDNAGIVRKSVGTSSTWASIALPFINNHGTIEVLSGGLRLYGAVTNSGTMSALGPILPALDGTILLDGGGLLGGTFFATNGAGFNLSGNAFTLADPLPLFSGPGQYKYTGQSLTLTSDVNSNLTLAGGYLYLSPTFQAGSITNLTLTGSILMGTNQVTGVLNWVGGYIGFDNNGGALTIASNGTLNVSGSAEKRLYEPLINAGTVRWSGGIWQLIGAASLYNLPGGLFDIQTDQSMNNSAISFSNAGLLQKSAGSGTTLFGAHVNNSGTVAVLSGTVNFPTSFTNTGSVMASNANINFGAPVFENSGTIRLESGSIYFTGQVTNNGTLEADGGAITIQNAYFGSSSASLAWSLGGPTNGTGYGQIQFNSPLTLGGTLSMTIRNGYLPTAGDLFHALTYPSATGAFACMNLDLGQGILLQPQFHPTALDLLATSYDITSTRPILSISRGLGTDLLVTWRSGFPGWILQSTTDLAAPSWAPVPSACGNQATIPNATPHQFFRLAKPGP